MAKNITEALKKCSSIKSGNSSPSAMSSIIELLATALCLVLVESAGMAQDLHKVIPKGLSQKKAEKIGVERLEKAEAKAKKNFEDFMTTFITDQDEQKMVMEAFDADIESIAD